MKARRMNLSHRILLYPYAVTSSLFLCLIASGIDTSIASASPFQDETDTPGGSIESIVAQNGMWGYDHRKHFQKKLLEFVSPVHKTSLISTQLVDSLSKVDENSSESRKNASDQISLSAASAMQLEQIARTTEQGIRLQLMQREGIQVGGTRSVVRAGGLVAKSAELKALTDLHRAKVEELRARFEAERATRTLRLENNLAKVKDLPLEPTKVKSGYPQNVILEALHEPLLKYAYVVAKEPFYEEHIKAIKMSLEDISKIRLRLDAEGKPIIFNVTESPADLGKLPYAMQHPDILPIARKLEARLGELRTTTNHDFYTTLRDLNDLHSQLEKVSIATLGTSRDNAAKGAHAYRIWCIAKDYRDKIRGILNRMEAEGVADGDWLRQSKFNPEVDGENVLSLVKYIVDNGCQIAPGLTGSEAAYLQLHMGLLRLQVILETE